MTYQIWLYGVILTSILLYAVSLALGDARPDYIPEDRVDVCELNHVYNKDGKHTFSQWIFWSWCWHHHGHVVVDWKWAHDSQTMPRRWVMVKEGEKTCVVRARSWRETWSQYDREIYDRRRVPQHERRGLIP